MPLDGSEAIRGEAITSVHTVSVWTRLASLPSPLTDPLMLSALSLRIGARCRLGVVPLACGKNLAGTGDSNVGRLVVEGKGTYYLSQNEILFLKPNGTRLRSRRGFSINNSCESSRKVGTLYKFYYVRS